MKVFIPNTQEDRLRQILNRVGLSFEPEVELLKCMLLRQFLLFAMQPKSYVVAIYKKYRVRKDVDQLNIKNVETKLITDLIAELDKARDRKKTGITKISENLIKDELLVSKMLVEEINALHKSECGKRKYTKAQFITMHKPKYDFDSEHNVSTIKYVNRHCECPPKLKKLMREYNIQLKYMIYYILLSANFPNDKKDQVIMQPQYIKRLVDLKLGVLEWYIDEAEKKVHQRDTLDIMYDDKFDNANILAWRIRTYLRGDGIVKHVTKQELRKEIVDAWKKLS